DGTAAGTGQVRDLRPGSIGSLPAKFVASGSLAYFVADDGTAGPELWRTDGTAAGTALARDVNPGAAGSGATGLVAFGGGILFAADDGTRGTEVWRSDGTAAGTAIVRDIEAPVRSSFPTASVAVGNRAVFSVTTGPNAGVWATDGSDAGTVLLTAATQIKTSGYTVNQDAGLPTYLVSRDVLYWYGTGGLWRTDGTPAGTYLLKALAGNTASQAAFASALADVGGQLFFSATGPTAGDELWTSDGTPDGTYLVADLGPGLTNNVPNNGSPRNLVGVGDAAYFTSLGRLYRSDGSAAGTVPIIPGTTFATTSRLTAFAGAAYLFAATTTGGPLVMWRTDGTAAGTAQVAGGAFKTDSSGVGRPAGTVFGGSLYFIGTRADGASGTWRLDPGSDAPVLVAAVQAEGPTVVRDRLYFVGNRYGLYGLDLGGAGGPTLLKTIPSSVTSIDG
ncbi:MAG: Flagellar hook-length control protein FliK, partial [Phycisphaerales bacterium]|nr:Flagellar hook-length control protein FliK [Phycisphaerales bacterium]